MPSCHRTTTKNPSKKRTVRKINSLRKKRRRRGTKYTQSHYHDKISTGVYFFSICIILSIKRFFFLGAIKWKWCSKLLFHLCHFWFEFVDTYLGISDIDILLGELQFSINWIVHDLAVRIFELKRFNLTPRAVHNNYIITQNDINDASNRNVFYLFRHLIL